MSSACLLTTNAWAQGEAFQAALAEMNASEVKKYHWDAKEEIFESKRQDSILSFTNIQTHTAAQEYLLLKDTPGAVSRQHIADKYEITPMMMRTAEEHLQHPFQVRKPGRLPLFEERDYSIIGNFVMDRALQDDAMTPDELRGFMLRVANVNLCARGKDPVTVFSNSSWKMYRAALGDYWGKMGVPIITRKKTSTKQAARAKAEKFAVPMFMELMKRLHAKYPEASKPENNANLDEQGLCDKPSNGKKVSTLQMPTVTGGTSTARASSLPPQPVTLVTVTFGDGTKGVVSILRKGTTPYIKQWFTNLPPGLTMEDVEATAWGMGDTDRMSADKFIDILDHVVYPAHSAKVAPGEQLFWFMDAPTCHGITQDYRIREEMVFLAMRLGICLVFLPHNSTHRLQANDFEVHLEEKAGIREIESAARACWDDPNRHIDQTKLAVGELSIITSNDGIADDGTARDASLRHRQFRAAHFHVGTNDQKFNWSQRDIIVAALWTWKFRITKEVILKSYAETNLLPFNPEGHKKYSDREGRVAAKLSDLPAKQNTLQRRRLEAASPTLTAMPKHPLPMSLPQDSSARVARRQQQEVNDERASQFLSELLGHSSIQLMKGMDRCRAIAGELNAYLNAVDRIDAKKVLVRGQGEIRYAQKKEDSFDDQLAKAQRSKDGYGVTRGLLNLSAGNNRCGLIFSGHEVRQQQATAALASSANLAAFDKRVTSAKMNLAKANATRKIAAAAAQAAQQASNAALEALEAVEASSFGSSTNSGMDEQAATPASAGPEKRRSTAEDTGGAAHKRAMTGVNRSTKSAAKTLNRTMARQATADKAAMLARKQLADLQASRKQAKAAQLKRLKALKIVKPKAVRAGLSRAATVGC